LELLSHLRNRFAKTAISEEDSFRLQSIRNSGTLREPARGECSSLDDFLQQVEGRLLFDLGKPVEDSRAFELINKTNQFNLNGKRYDQATWSKFLKDAGTYLVTVSYEDKFGKLGRIAVLMGSLVEKRFVVRSWVMSCRAFSRRIEHHCLKYLFDRFSVTELIFEVQATSRNGPLMEFLREFLDGSVEANPRLTKSSFLRKAPKMPHRVEELFADE
jgi:FkbH-like protein